MHVAPPALLARLRQLPDFVSFAYNETVGRWELVLLSAANKPVSQFWGWFHNPLTGEKIAADPISGLAPYRDIDSIDAQNELVASLEMTYIAGPHEAGSHLKKSRAAQAYNASLRRQSAKARGQGYADLIKEVDLRRPWVKYHGPDRQLLQSAAR